jgi:hypothetical protein
MISLLILVTVTMNVGNSNCPMATILLKQFPHQRVRYMYRTILTCTFIHVVSVTTVTVFQDVAECRLVTTTT